MSNQNKRYALYESNPIKINEKIKKRKIFNINTQYDYCPECKDNGIIILDSSEGTQICNSCGLVLETDVVSNEQEWRCFSSDGADKNDRNRVGEISDIWLENNVSSTTFIKSSKKLQHLNLMTQINKNDQMLISAFSILKLICDTFFLRTNVIERAKEIVKELKDIHQLKNKANTLYMLAVVYLACREAGHIKSIKELITYDRTYKEKDLGKTINKLKKLLPHRAFVHNEDVSDLIYSLSNRLQLSFELIEAIEYVVKKATVLITTSHRLNSLCGGSIYLIVELTTSINIEKSNLPSLSEIADVCSVTTNTLKTTFKELLSASEYILPKNYLTKHSSNIAALKKKHLTDEKKKKK